MIDRRTLNRSALALLTVFTWVIVIARIQPWPFSDYAVFLTVARRLSAGDVLYQGIWDNKDPFVYYSIALLQNLGQPALWALELLWFVVASAAAYAIARSYHLSREWSILLGAVATPIVLIPFHYFPGTTHLPGVALTLLALAFVITNRYGASGLVLGLLVFFKLSMLPIALVGISAVVMKRHRLQATGRLFLGLLVMLAAGVMVLIIRGEFIPYLGSLAHNFTYSQTNTNTGGTDLLAVATERVSVFTDMHVLITVLTIAAILASTAVRRRTVELWDVAAGTFVVAVLSTMAIGKFPHHAQVMGVSSTLALVVLVVAVNQGRMKRPVLIPVAVLSLAVLLTGLPSLKGYRDALINPQGTWQAMTRTDVSTQDLLDSGPPRTFAIVQGGGLPRSPGLEDWQLVCRHIAQRPWESAELLQESLDCFPNAEVLLVGKDFVQVSKPAAYARFTQAVSELIEAEYQCEQMSQSQVCNRENS